MGPSVLTLPTTDVSLQLQGAVDTRSLLVCSSDHSEAGAIDVSYFDLLEGKGTPEQMAALLRSEWRVIRANPRLSPIDVCSQSFEACPRDEVDDYCQEDLGTVPSSRTLSLSLPPSFLQPARTYYVALDNRIGDNDPMCTSMEVIVDEEPLAIDLFAGIYQDASSHRDEAMGGKKRAFNLGVGMRSEMSLASHQRQRFWQ